jgi:hypothetical protein
MGLVLWSPVLLVGGGGGAGSLGAGVELRAPDQGLMESTADAQVDLSAFLSAADPEAIFLCHAEEAPCPKEDQVLLKGRPACLLSTRDKATGDGDFCGANFEM